MDFLINLRGKLIIFNQFFLTGNFALLQSKILDHQLDKTKLLKNKKKRETYKVFVIV